MKDFIDKQRMKFSKNNKDLSRDYYMLSGPLARNGYDWWWHSFTGYQKQTGKSKVFFIEYFVCNPALGGDKAILGQLPQNKTNRIKPSYALVKVGSWEKTPVRFIIFIQSVSFHAQRMS